MAWAFYIVAMFICLSCVTMFFFMPETKFTGTRPSILPDLGIAEEKAKETRIEDASAMTGEAVGNAANVPHRRSFWGELALFHKPDTHESFTKVFMRPFVLLTYPTILWACFVYGMSLGWNVIIGATVAQLFAPQYGFDSQAQGLVFLSPFVGSLLGTWLCGSLSDTFANYATKKNDGIREPEMRLPICAVASFLTFFGTLIAGLTYNYNTHWIGPVMGLGVLTTGAQMGVSLSMSYAIDSHKEVSRLIDYSICCANHEIVVSGAHGCNCVPQVCHRVDLDVGHQ